MDLLQIVTAGYTDLQDYTYYFVPAPWLCVKLLRLLQNYPPPGEFLFWLHWTLCYSTFDGLRCEVNNLIY